MDPLPSKIVMNRKASTLFLLAAVIGTALYILLFEENNWRRLSSRDIVSTSVLWPDEQVTYLSFQQDQLRIDCERRDGKWYITHPYTAPANEGEVERLLSKLRRVRTTERITRADRLRRNLGLSDFGLVRPRHTLVVGDGATRRTIHFGRRSPMGGSLYLKEDSTEEVHVVGTNALACFPGSVHDLRNRQLLTDRPQSVKKLEWQGASGYVSAGAGLAGEWRVLQPFEDRAEPTRIRAFIEALGALQILDFVSDDVSDTAPYGFEETGQQLVVTYENGRSDRYRIGYPGESGESWVYVYSEQDGAVYAVDARIREWVNRSAEDIRRSRLLMAEPGDMEAVEVSAGEDRLRLEHREEGWLITAPRHWRASPERIDRLLTGWTEAEAVLHRPVQSNTLAAYAFDPPDMTLIFERSVGENGARETIRQTLEIGLYDTSRTQLWVHVAGNDWLRSVPGELRQTLSLNPLFFKDRQLWRVAPDQLQFFSLQAADREVVLRRQSEGEIQVMSGAGEREAGQWLALAAMMTDLTTPAYIAYDVADLAGYGLDTPRITVTLGYSGEPGGLHTLWVGRPRDAQSGFAMIQGRDGVFVLADPLWSALEDLTARTSGVDDSEPPVSGDSVDAADD